MLMKKMTGDSAQNSSTKKRLLKKCRSGGLIVPARYVWEPKKVAGEDIA
jgi:hypothetical protein